MTDLLYYITIAVILPGAAIGGLRYANAPDWTFVLVLLVSLFGLAILVQIDYLHRKLDHLHRELRRGQ
jgi:hypothetical protein